MLMLYILVWFLCFFLGAGVAGCWCGAAEAEHRGPNRRPQPGEPAPRGRVCSAAQRARKQRLRPLQGRTVPQCHASCRLPHTGPWGHRNESWHQQNWHQEITVWGLVVLTWVWVFAGSDLVPLSLQLHCWTPEEACEKLASVRPHILVRSAQLDMLRRYHQQVCGRSSWEQNPATPGDGGCSQAPFKSSFEEFYWKILVSFNNNQ